MEHTMRIFELMLARDGEPFPSRIYVPAASEDIAVREGAAAVGFASCNYQYAIMATPFMAGPDEGIQLRPR